MKQSHAILIAVAILAFGCCGGVFFLGKRAYSGYSENNSEATALADKALPPILQTWDYKLLQKQATPEFLRDQPDTVLATWFDFYKTKLGKFQGIDPSTVAKSSFYTTPQGTMIRSLVQARASFYRDNATISLDMIKRDNKWAINGFYIKAQVFKPDTPKTPSPPSPQSQTP